MFTSKNKKQKKMNDTRFFLTEEQYTNIVSESGLKRLGDLYNGDSNSYFDSIYEGMELLGYTGAVLRVVKWEGSGVSFKDQTLSQNGMVNLTDDDTILIEGPKGIQPYFLPYRKGLGLAIL